MICGKNKILSKMNFISKKKIPFCGGWFVYLGYELAKEIEPSLHTPSSPFKLPTAFASRVSTAIVFDHIDNEIFVVSGRRGEIYSNLSEIESDFSEIIENKNSLSGEIKILAKEVILNTRSKLENVLITFFREKYFRLIYQDYGNLK